MFRPSKRQSFAFKVILLLALASPAGASVSDNEILLAMGERLNALENAEAWHQFVKSHPESFPDIKEGASVFVDKMPLDLKGDSFTLGTGYRQIFMKASLERVKAVLNSTEVWKDLYGLDANADVGRDGANFKARIFKKIPVISNQDYVLEYRNFESGGLWYQRAKQAEDKNQFALRDNLKTLEKVDGGVIFREYSIVYVLRWYLRALGPQMRSVMKDELTKINASVKCAAESEKPINSTLAADCWKIAQSAKPK